MSTEDEKYKRLLTGFREEESLREEAGYIILHERKNPSRTSSGGYHCDFVELPALEKALRKAGLRCKTNDCSHGCPFRRDGVRELVDSARRIAYENKDRRRKKIRVDISEIIELALPGLVQIKERKKESQNRRLAVLGAFFVQVGKMTMFRTHTLRKALHL